LVTWIAAAPGGGLPRDHARRVAAGVAATLDVPAVRLLAPAPGPDLGRARRAGAAASRPAPRPRRRLAGGRVLVVDDLATTGATLAGAAAALRRAGAGHVEGAVVGAAGTAFGPVPAVGGATLPGMSAALGQITVCAAQCGVLCTCAPVDPV
ncbi:MAG TPA: phosphoribosyltransferase family protein, partial [Actinomycetota bacterium]|nr:phosphoribosyltransferase family protein [Actinomycetota bacterium]